MTVADWLAFGGIAVTILLNAAGWLVAAGRWSKGLEALEKAVATKAPAEDVTALSGRVEVLERDMREVIDMKSELKSHANLTTEKFASMSQQTKDGFERVAGEVRAFDRLVSSQLDEIKHRLRDPAKA